MNEEEFKAKAKARAAQQSITDLLGSAKYPDDIKHRDEVWWYDAPLPRRWHRVLPVDSGVARTVQPEVHRTMRLRCHAYLYP